MLGLVGHKLSSALYKYFIRMLVASSADFNLKFEIEFGFSLMESRMTCLWRAIFFCCVAGWREKRASINFRHKNFRPIRSRRVRRKKWKCLLWNFSVKNVMRRKIVCWLVKKKKMTNVGRSFASSFPVDSICIKFTIVSGKKRIIK